MAYASVLEQHPAPKPLSANGSHTDTIDQLAAGLGSGVTVTCVNLGPSLQATATVHFDGWLTSVSDHDSTMQATAALENQT